MNKEAIDCSEHNSCSIEPSPAIHYAAHFRELVFAEPLAELAVVYRIPADLPGVIRSMPRASFPIG